MMARAAVVTLIALLAVAGTIAENNVKYTSDKKFIKWQKFLFQLFWKPTDVQKYFPQIARKAQNFKVEDLRQMSVDQDIAEDFIARYKYGLLPPGRSATAFYPPHLAEIKSYSDLTLSVRDFDDFAVISLWGCKALNPMIWYFSLIATVLQRHETKRINIPNSHECLPNYSFNTDVILKWQSLQNQTYCSANINERTITAGYSNMVEGGIHDREVRLTYFTEDVGLENYYFYAAVEFPFWMNTGLCQSSYRRGERYFFDHTQLLSRYHLERLSNDLDEIEDIDWDQNILAGFYSNVIDYNGNKFPSRPPNKPIQINKYRFALRAKQSEDRLDAVADGHALFIKDAKNVYNGTRDGVFNDLMNAAQGNGDSVNPDYYDSLEFTARQILGWNPEPLNKFNVNISVLQNYNLDKRDPAFYRMFKKVVDVGYRYKAHLGPYTRKELEFPGVSIQKLSTDRLETFFDKFDSILGYQKCQSKDIPILATQNRLNHKPFTVSFKVHSTNASKAVIRIFLGPKYNGRGYELDIDESRRNFFQLDEFVVTLKKGVNELCRNDSDFVYQLEEPPRSDITYSHILRAAEGKEELTYRDQPYGIPRRLMLPKGNAKGLPLRLFAIVSPLDEDRVRHVDTLIAGMNFSDGRAMGFPLDRPIVAYRFRTPNMAFNDVTIYHLGRREGKRFHLGEALKDVLTQPFLPPHQDRTFFHPAGGILNFRI